MVRIALLSFWHVHAADYAREANAHPGAEVAAIWDEDAARGRIEAERRGVRFVERLAEVLADPAIDGVIVTAPTTMHRDLMVAAGDAGKPIFAEKVIAPT